MGIKSDCTTGHASSSSSRLHPRAPVLPWYLPSSSRSFILSGRVGEPPSIHTTACFPLSARPNALLNLDNNTFLPPNYPFSIPFHYSRFFLPITTLAYPPPLLFFADDHCCRGILDLIRHSKRDSWSVTNRRLCGTKNLGLERLFLCSIQFSITRIFTNLFFALRLRDVYWAIC